MARACRAADRARGGRRAQRARHGVVGGCRGSRSGLPARGRRGRCAHPRPGTRRGGGLRRGGLALQRRRRRGHLRRQHRPALGHCRRHRHRGHCGRDGRDPLGVRPGARGRHGARLHAGRAPLSASGPAAVPRRTCPARRPRRHGARRRPWRVRDPRFPRRRVHAASARGALVGRLAPGGAYADRDHPPVRWREPRRVPGSERAAGHHVRAARHRYGHAGRRDHGRSVLPAPLQPHRHRPDDARPVAVRVHVPGAHRGPRADRCGEFR